MDASSKSKRMKPLPEASSPIVIPHVLSGHVNMDLSTGERAGEGWWRIECHRHKAYGCGERGQAVVEGLELHLRVNFDPDLTSFLAISMSDTALRAIRLELGLAASCDPTRCNEPELRSGAIVQAAHDNLVVVLLTFAAGTCELAYYLVYDSIDASLFMIKTPPDNIHATACTRTPVAIRRSASGGDFELVLLAREWEEFDDRDPKDVLAVCTPATLVTGSPWLIKERRLQGESKLPFIADMVFCHRGLAFWADLSQGLLYCDPREPCSVVDLHFIRLPAMYLRVMDDMRNYDHDDNNPQWWFTRTVGRYGPNNVCFVSLDVKGAIEGEPSVRMWNLDLADPHGGWSKEVDISFTELRAIMDGFRDGFVDAGLPQAARPICPVLLPDRTLTLLLPGNSRTTGKMFGPIIDHICCFDMFGRRLLWCRTVRDYQRTAAVILPLDFLLTSCSRTALEERYYRPDSWRESRPDCWRESRPDSWGESRPDCWRESRPDSWGESTPDSWRDDSP